MAIMRLERQEQALLNKASKLKTQLAKLELERQSYTESILKLDAMTLGETVELSDYQGKILGTPEAYGYHSREQVIAEIFELTKE